MSDAVIPPTVVEPSVAPKPPRVRSKYASPASEGKKKKNKKSEGNVAGGGGGGGVSVDGKANSNNGDNTTHDGPDVSLILNELKNTRATVDSLQVELKAAKEELEMRRRLVGQLRGDVAKEEEKYAHLLEQKIKDDREFGKLKGSYEVARAELAELRQQLSAARAEAEDLRERSRQAAVASQVTGKRAALDMEEGDRAVEESRRMIAAERAAKTELMDEVQSLRSQLEAKRLEVDAGLRVRQELREEKDQVARAKAALAECEARLAKATAECQEAKQRQQREESELRIAQATLRDERINEKERTKHLEASLAVAQETAALAQQHCEALKVDLASERQLRRVLQDKLVDLKVSTDPKSTSRPNLNSSMSRLDSPTSRLSPGRKGDLTQSPILQRTSGLESPHSPHRRMSATASSPLLTPKLQPVANDDHDSTGSEETLSSHEDE